MGEVLLLLVLGDSLPGLEAGAVWVMRLGSMRESWHRRVSSSPDTSLTRDVRTLYSDTIW